MAIRSAAGDLLYRRANLPASTAFTASMWVWMVDPVGFQDSWFGMSDATSSPSNWLWMLGNSSSNFAINNSGADDSEFTTDIATGEWSFVALRQLSGVFKGYHWDKDGTLQTTTITVSPGWTNAQFSVASDAFGNATDMRVAAIKLWDAGLSDAEIEAERLQIQPRQFEDLNGFWPCFPGSAERLRDYSGKGRDLGASGSFTDEQGPPIGWGGVPIIVASTPTYDSIAEWGAADAQFPSANFPELVSIHSTERRRVLAFDDTTEETATFDFIVGAELTGPLKAVLVFSMASATSGTVQWGASLEAVTPDSDTIDLDAATSYDTENLGALQLVPGTAGHLAKQEIALNNDDGLAAGDLARIRVRYKTAGTATGDAQLHAVELQEAA